MKVEIEERIHDLQEIYKKTRSIATYNSKIYVRDLVAKELSQIFCSDEHREMYYGNIHEKIAENTEYLKSIQVSESDIARINLPYENYKIYKTLKTIIENAKQGETERNSIEKFLFKAGEDLEICCPIPITAVTEIEKILTTNNTVNEEIKEKLQTCKGKLKELASIAI